MSWRTRPGRHRWKGSVARNPYALIFAPRLRDWVRVFYFGPDDYAILDLDNRVMAHD